MNLYRLCIGFYSKIGNRKFDKKSSFISLYLDDRCKLTLIKNFKLLVD